MASPFPGMDPYLENRDHWRGFHARLIAYAAEILNTSLPRGYFAEIDERLYLLPADDLRYPDVSVLRRGPEIVREAQVAELPSEALDAPIVVHAQPVQIKERFIEIHTSAEPRRIVTVVEVLSPTNKAAGKGRRTYLEKQQNLLASEVNLLEIDLLRTGRHTVAVPRARLRAFGRWDYLACLHRPVKRYDFECWQIGLQQRLPRVRIPLLGSDPDVLLDLQQVVNRSYDAGRYSEQIDYRLDSLPPLTDEDAAWADMLLRDKGLRQ